MDQHCTLAGIFVIMFGKPVFHIGLQANWQQMATGAVLIIAVLIDIMKEKESSSKIISKLNRRKCILMTDEQQDMKQRRASGDVWRQ